MEDQKKAGLSALPIGVFDSGIGGLSVLRYAMRLLPNESFIYYGDTANAPYGNKPESEIRDLTLRCGEYLYSRGVKAIVMACNTATSAAVITMRELYNIPVISIEPAVKPAIEASSDGLVVVLATPATIAQRRYRALVERLDCTGRVVSIACESLASMVETMEPDSPEIEEYLSSKFNPLAGENVSGIVLGCTHYAFAADAVRRAAERTLCGKRGLYDGAGGTARQLRRVLLERGIESSSPLTGSVELCSSGGPEEREHMRRVLERPIIFLEN